MNSAFSIFLDADLAVTVFIAMAGSSDFHTLACIEEEYFI